MSYLGKKFGFDKNSENKMEFSGIKDPLRPINVVLDGNSKKRGLVGNSEKIWQIFWFSGTNDEFSCFPAENGYFLYQNPFVHYVVLI